MTQTTLIHPKQLNFEIFITILTILSWLNFFLFLFSTNPDTRIVVLWAEILLTPIFLLDFLLHRRFLKKHQEPVFSPYNWLDLIGSFPFLRWARIVRVHRFTRFLRETEGRSLIKQFAHKRAETAVFSLLLAVILLFEFASISILKAEAGAANATIITVEDAVWWILVTIATVGYGDFYPVTNQGRFIAAFVMLAGVGLFGVLSGYLARLFLGERPSNNGSEQSAAPPDATSILLELQAIRQEQAQMRQEQAGENGRLEQRLQQLERLLTKADPKDKP